jgi:pilus assembly protein CpaC
MQSIKPHNGGRAVLKRKGVSLFILSALMVVPETWSGPAQAFEVVATDTERNIALVVGTGQLVRVDREFSSLFVANPDVADIQVKSPRLLYLTGVGVGETTLFAVDDADNVLMSSTIRVTHNTNALQQGLSRVAPGQSVTATTVDRSLVISGSVATPAQAADIMQVATQFVSDPAQVVNRIDVAAPTQVNLQVRIAEVSRNIDRQLGIRWNELSYGLGGDSRVGLINSGSVAVNSGGYNVAYARSGRLNVNVVLQALAEEGLVSILAEPNLTARSGEPASFLAGGEFPYTVEQELDQGGITRTVQFKEFGIRLNFTPTVVDGDRISLRVATEVSDLDFTKDTDQPALNTRRADTTIDLASGQSFAIAGLMSNTTSNSFAGMPGLSSVPVVGALFRSNGFKRGQTELVVIVTPVIVSPTSARQLRTPVDTFVPPNDFERILLGRVQGDAERASRVQSRIGQRRLNGATGFVFE